MNIGQFYKLPDNEVWADFIQVQISASGGFYPYIISEEHKGCGEILSDFLRDCGIEPKFTSEEGIVFPQKRGNFYWVLGAGQLYIERQNIFFYKGNTPYGNGGANIPSLKNAFGGLGYKLIKMIDENKYEDIN